MQQLCEDNNYAVNIVWVYDVIANRNCEGTEQLHTEKNTGGRHEKRESRSL